MKTIKEDDNIDSPWFSFVVDDEKIDYTHKQYTDLNEFHEASLITHRWKQQPFKRETNNLLHFRKTNNPTNNISKHVNNQASQPAK